MEITTCVIGFSHKGSLLTVSAVCDASNMCALSSRVQAKNLCKGEGGWTTQPTPHPPAHLSRMCSHTYQHMHTVPTLHVTVHTLPTHLLLATLVESKRKTFFQFTANKYILK